MRVLITGSHGLIGRALVGALAEQGHEVTRLVRCEPRAGRGEVRWNPAEGTIDAAGLEGHDAVVHLAGENIMGRWTAAKKARIYDSRAVGTRLLSEALAGVARPPRALLAASAAGFYGSRGDEVLTEDSPSGEGFLAALCRDWEAATQPAARRGIRVVNLRLGVVLSPTGGALATMLLPFRLGLGGVLGSGRQWMSWTHIADTVGAIKHVLADGNLRGPVNLTAPNPVTNREFTKTLGRMLRRPTVLPAPAFVLRLVFGELADAALLASQRVEPVRLLASGYAFRFPELGSALRHLLKRGARNVTRDA